MEPVLSRVTAREIPESAITLQANITQKMPTRNLPDILVNIEHWTNFTRHFGPLSGSDPKIDRAAERYIQTVFAIGCNLGPHQAARHMSGTVSAHMRSFVNRRHITVEKLEAAQRELIELYLQLDLPKAWGDGKTIAADGTQYDFYEENLLAGYHFRYRKMGAVAYRHVANNYIAVFCRFIPPGVWEAIYVIDGLINTQLSVQPDTVHADTQGQSTTVFAFTYLTGINLMPRIRNWKDLTFFRPGKNAHYQHIDTLFTDTIDWDLIETHWQDLMPVALSNPGRQDLFIDAVAETRTPQPQEPAVPGVAGTRTRNPHAILARMDLESAAAPTGHWHHQQDRIVQRFCEVAFFWRRGDR